MSRYFRGFGEEYVGPGSPGYNYATPAQQEVADMANAYTGSAYSNPNQNYVGTGTLSSTPAAQTVSEGGGGEGAAGVFDKIFSIFDRGLVSVNKVVDIFGRPVQQQPVARPSSSVPIWVYLSIPVALIGVVALMRRKPSRRVGSYKRRRRSKR